MMDASMTRKIMCMLTSTALFSLYLFFIDPAPAHATTLIKMDLKELVRHSDQIITGRVLSLKGVYEHGRVFTYVTIKVTERLKGGGQSQVTLRLLGGLTKDLGTLIAGQANFFEGEDTLVFLQQQSASKYLIVTGMSQGKFTLSPTDTSNQPRYVIPQGVSTPLLQPLLQKDNIATKSRLQKAAPAPIHVSISRYQDVKRRIRTLLTHTPSTFTQGSSTQSSSTQGNLN